MFTSRDVSWVVNKIKASEEESVFSFLFKKKPQNIKPSTLNWEKNNIRALRPSGEFYRKCYWSSAALQLAALLLFQRTIFASFSSPHSPTPFPQYLPPTCIPSSVLFVFQTSSSVCLLVPELLHLISQINSWLFTCQSFWTTGSWDHRR